VVLPSDYVPQGCLTTSIPLSPPYEASYYPLTATLLKRESFEMITFYYPAILITIIWSLTDQNLKEVNHQELATKEDILNFN
jgi:hypothetical protein